MKNDLAMAYHMKRRGKKMAEGGPVTADSTPPEPNQKNAAEMQKGATESGMSFMKEGIKKLMSGESYADGGRVGGNEDLHPGSEDVDPMMMDPYMEDDMEDDSPRMAQGGMIGPSRIMKRLQEKKMANGGFTGPEMGDEESVYLGNQAEQDFLGDHDTIQDSHSGLAMMDDEEDGDMRDGGRGMMNAIFNRLHAKHRGML